MKILKIFLLSLLIWLQHSLWLGKNGIFDYIKVYKKVIIKKKNNLALDIRNKKIILEIKNFNDHIKKKNSSHTTYFK